MAYTIPNDSDPAYFDTEFQSRPFAADFDILQAGIAGRNGVIGGGCGVTAHAPPNMTVTVASGSVAINATLVVVTGATVTLGAADPTDPRFDLIIAKSDGTVDVIPGNPDQSPLLPTPAPNTVVLASVFVPDATPTIQTSQIVDKRIPVQDPTQATGGWTTVTATGAGVTRSNTNTLSTNIDPTLQVAMATNTKYRIRMFVLFRQLVASNNVKLGFGGPASPALLHGHGVTFAGTPPNAFGALAPSGLYVNVYDTTTGQQLNLPGLNYTASLKMEFIIHNTTAGNFGLYWCQTTSNASSIMRVAGSYIESLAF